MGTIIAKVSYSRRKPPEDKTREEQVEGSVRICSFVKRYMMLQKCE